MDSPVRPAAELDRGGVLAAPTVQRLACDATITRVLVDARSQVIDVGRSARVVSAPTRRALNIRDRGCRWPGCDRPPTWTSAHHVLHWAAHRGATDTANMVLLCRHHHWCVHEGGWTLLHGDDEILAVSPVTKAMTPLRPPSSQPATDFGRAYRDMTARGRRAREPDPTGM